MSFVKYRVKEVAADFGMTPKEMSEIIGKFGEKPKSYTQALEDSQLNMVFEYMTQNHQISSLEQVFAVKPTAPKQEPKAEPQKEAQKPSQPQAKANNNNNNNNARPQNAPKPQSAPAQQAAPKAEKPKEPERKRERRVVDTSAVQVNSKDRKSVV